jgi:hypothetical protein
MLLHDPGKFRVVRANLSAVLTIGPAAVVDADTVR